MTTHNSKIYLFLFALIAYIITLKFHRIYESTIVPFGDPFTYSVGFFKIIDLYESKGYLSTIWRMLTDHPNWYWLQNLLISLLAPVMNKTMTSISLINYFIFFIASISFYQLGIKCGINSKISLLGGLIPWIYPVNYGFTTYASITVTGLDASFTASLYIALAMLLIFVIEPRNTKYAIFSGFAAGFALWGRGNSLPVVGLVLFLPSILLLLKSLKNKQVQINILVSLFIFICMASYFYTNTYEAISSYYNNHLTFFTRHEWNLLDAKKWLLNIPGYLFWQNENSLISVSMTIFTHLLNLYVLWFIFIQKKHSIEKILLITGVFIYFSTFFINIILFTDPLFTLQNCILQYQPMLVGLSCSILGLVIHFSKNRKFSLSNNFFNYLFILFFLFNTYMFTNLQTPYEWAKGRPSPEKVQAFSLSIDELTNNGKASFLWYGFYNPAIVNYYRVIHGVGKIKNNLYENPVYMGEFYNNMWSASDRSPENREKVKLEIRDHFENADIIVIPEKLAYLSHNPYAFCYFSNDIAKYVKSRDFPRLAVLKRIEDSPKSHILVLKRYDDLDENLKNNYEEFDTELFLDSFKPRIE